MSAPDQEFVDKCWTDLKGKPNDKGNHNDYLLDEFLKCSPDRKEVAEYILKLYAHEAAGNRANDAEWAWRFGVAAAFFVVAIGYLYQHVTEGTSQSAILSMFHALAAAVVFTAPWWRSILRR